MRPLAEGTVISQIAAARTGKPAGLVACMAPALLMFPALLATYAIMAIGVALGWMAFFFPALWVYTRLSFAPYLVVLHRHNPIQAIRQSFIMTERQQWPLLLMVVVVFLAYLLASSSLAQLISALVSHSAAANLLIALPVSLLATGMNVAVFPLLGTVWHPRSIRAHQPLPLRTIAAMAFPGLVAYFQEMH